MPVAKNPVAMSNRLIPALVAMACLTGGVKLEGNRLDTRDGRATIIHGQMEPGEIHVAAETGWNVDPF